MSSCMEAGLLPVGLLFILLRMCTCEMARGNPKLRVEPSDWVSGKRLVSYHTGPRREGPLHVMVFRCVCVSAHVCLLNENLLLLCVVSDHALRLST